MPFFGTTIAAEACPREHLEYVTPFAEFCQGVCVHVPMLAVPRRAALLEHGATVVGDVAFLCPQAVSVSIGDGVERDHPFAAPQLGPMWQSATCGTRRYLLH